jgi:hypothetical protein
MANTLNVNDEIFLPGTGGNQVVQTSGAKFIGQLRFVDFYQRTVVEEEIVWRGLPARWVSFFIDFHAAAGNDVVNVRMIGLQVAAPSVQDSKESELTVLQRSRRCGDVADTLATGVEQASITLAIKIAQHHCQLTGNRERDKEVMNRHQFGSLLLDPDLRFLVTASGTVAIAAAASNPVFAAAVIALKVDATECTRAASHDQREDFLLASR